MEPFPPAVGMSKRQLGCKLSDEEWRKAEWLQTAWSPPKPFDPPTLQAVLLRCLDLVYDEFQSQLAGRAQTERQAKRHVESDAEAGARVKDDGTEERPGKAKRRRNLPKTNEPG
jgi:hypothetical protein